MKHLAGLLALLAISLVPLLAQPPLPPEATPKDVRTFIIAAADALTNKDSRDFLDRFDGKMTGFDMLSYQTEALLAHDQVLSTVEIVSDTGDEHQRAMQLDWILTVDSDRPIRKLVTVKIEKQGKKWKFTSLDPIDFFKTPN